MIDGYVAWRSANSPRLRRAAQEPLRNHLGELVNRRGVVTDYVGAIGDGAARHHTYVLDRSEDVMYIVRASMPASDGWAPSSFWQKRWAIEHAAVLLFVDLGLLEPGVLADSIVRKYRCPDERSVLESREYRQRQFGRVKHIAR